MSTFPINDQNEIKRLPERGIYEKDQIYKIVDEALICHIGFIQGDQPFVIPCLHARIGDNLILHGSKDSRLMTYIQSGNKISIEMTLLDGLVLAKSASHHSMNYRSVVLFGTGKAIENNREKIQALRALSEHILPGRWEDVRKPSTDELDATEILSISIDHASAKIRTGPPEDDADDAQLSIWSGHIPLQLCALPAESSPQIGSDIEVPDYVIKYRR